MKLNVLVLFFALASLFGVFIVFSINSNTEAIYEEIEQNLEVVLNDQEQDLYTFENKFSVYTNPFFITDPLLFQKRVYVNGELVYWNGTDYLGDYSQLKSEDPLYIYEHGYGVKLVRRKEIRAGKDLIEIFSFADLYNDPKVRNRYLSKELNPLIFKNYPVELSFSKGRLISYSGKGLFFVQVIRESTAIWEFLSLILVLFSALCLVILFFRIPFFSRLPRYIQIILLGLIFITGRVVLWYWTEEHITHWELFRPINFTAEPVFYSLGDTILHLILSLIWITIVYWFFFYRSRQNTLSDTGKIAYALLIVLAISGVAFMSYHGAWLVLENSQIEFDIAESIFLNPLRLGGFVYLILLGINAVIIYSMLIRAYSWLGLPVHFHYLIIFIGYLSTAWIDRNGWIYVGGFFLSWLIIEFFGISRHLKSTRYIAFVYLLILISAFAASYACAIYKHSEKDDLIAKQKFGNKLLIKNDILGELYLKEMIQEVAKDSYVRSRLMNQLLSTQNIREKIKRQFLPPYLKKYDLEVYLFDPEGNPLESSSTSLLYSEWANRYKKDSLKTDYDKIYFVQGTSDNPRNKYISFLDIESFGRLMGYMVLELSLKKFIPTSVFPELLLESRYHVGEGYDFDYAVYKGGEFLYKQGRFNFENKLSYNQIKQTRLYKKGVEWGGFSYYGIETQDGQKIIMVSPTYRTRAIIANASFIFLLLLLAFSVVLFFFQLLAGDTYLNMSGKIQLFLGLSLIIPMLIVGIALLNTLNRSYKEEIDRNFQKRSYNLAENLIDPTEFFLRNKINIDEYANKVSEAGSIAQSDLNIYDIDGKLITSTQPEIFKLGLLADIIDPEAYSEIKFKQEQNKIIERSIGTLDFKTSYTALRAYSDGRLLAILAIPYFDSKNHLRKQQVEVFGNLISIFTVTFLVLILIGNVIVGKLVRPLKKIGEKLRSTSLEEENQPIEYEGHDEIGSLITEYNLMLLKLEESKAALALSQKESAWKEIARQVAHEIKNPLTPMRLKVQQMMRSFDPDHKNYKACLTLIDQVDTLSSIADSFSEFAKMPAPNNKPTNICKLLESVALLYQSKTVKIEKSFPKNCPEVMIDPKIFTGIFTNIILNASQARKNETIQIDLKVVQLPGKLQITLKDNGRGVPIELRENIFTPYFSTKSQGSGIGLALAKKGIENAGGNIWFESEEGVGTTFFINLPVI